MSLTLIFKIFLYQTDFFYRIILNSWDNIKSIIGTFLFHNIRIIFYSNYYSFVMCNVNFNKNCTKILFRKMKWAENIFDIITLVSHVFNPSLDLLLNVDTYFSNYIKIESNSKNRLIDHHYHHHHIVNKHVIYIIYCINISVFIQIIHIRSLWMQVSFAANL